MLAYVKLVQSREKELGCDVLTHQKWSGASYIDGILGHIQSGSSGSKSMGEGNTETGMFQTHYASAGSDHSARVLDTYRTMHALLGSLISPFHHLSILLFAYHGRAAILHAAR